MVAPSQLERLARPFPAKYVRKPAQGKYGDYVPHHIATQALLAIVGPFDLDVGQVFYGWAENGNGAPPIEGCLVTLTCTIDGERVSITEIGDCEQPGNWKTQGARMKDAISDGVKRCAARLGLGLHLYSGSDYFLYDQLRTQAGVEKATPPGSAVQRQNVAAKYAALVAEGAEDLDEMQAMWNLPSIEAADDKQLGAWAEMLRDVEAALEAPFMDEKPAAVTP